MQDLKEGCTSAEQSGTIFINNLDVKAFFSNSVKEIGVLLTGNASWSSCLKLKQIFIVWCMHSALIW